MKYDMELTLVVRTKTDDGNPVSYDTQSIDRVVGSNLTELLGQFLIVLASVHHRMIQDYKMQNGVFNDDDIPF